MAVSRILTYIAEQVLAFTKAVASAELSDQVKERASEGPQSLDGVAKALNELERTVADYEEAFQSARLRAHTVVEKPHPKSAALLACNTYARLPELRAIRETIQQVRELGHHNEEVVQATIMRLDAEVEIEQERVDVHLRYQAEVARKDQPQRPFDEEAREFAQRLSANRALGHSKIVYMKTAASKLTIDRASGLRERISRLIGTLEYLAETMEKEDSTFVLLDEKICDAYALKAKAQ